MHCTHSCTQPGATVPCIKINRISHLITHVLIQSISKDQVRRFIRLTNLIPEILDMVDNKKIALNPAVELSYLKPAEQEMLLDAMDCEQTTSSLSQAQRLKRFSQEGKLTEESMLAIMSEEKKQDVDRVLLTRDMQ